MSDPVDPLAFVEWLRPAVRQAASIAVALEGRVANQPKEAETSAVKQALTVADTAAQEAIVVPLYERFPAVALEAEEDTETARLFASAGDEKVVIDPIDGTLHSYLRGEGPYAVMVGYARAGRYEAALVALPREGLFLDATRGGGAFLASGAESRQTSRCLPSAADDCVLVSNGMPAAVVGAIRALGWPVRSACGGAVAVAPLLPGVRAGVRWASGEGGVSVRGRIGVLIAREAGATVRGADDGAFPDDLLTAAPGLVVASSAEEAQLLADVLRQNVD